MGLLRWEEATRQGGANNSGLTSDSFRMFEWRSCRLSQRTGE